MRWIFFLLFLFLNVFSVFAQKNYNLAHYTSKNGLPQNSVKSLSIDKNGFTWMTTEAGLVRFDGINFKVYNSTTAPILKGNRLREITTTLDTNLVFTDEIGNAFLINETSNSINFFDSAVNRNFIYLHGSFLNLEQLKFFLIELRNKDSEFLNGPMEIISFPINNKMFAILSKKKIFIIDKLKVIRQFPMPEIPINYFFMVDSNLYFHNSNYDFFYVNTIEEKIEECSFKSYVNDAAIKWDEQNSESYFVSKGKLYSITCKEKKILKADLLSNQLPTGSIITKIIRNNQNNTVLVGTDNQGLFILQESNFKNLRYTKSTKEFNNVYYSQIAIDSNRVLTHNGFIASVDSIYPSPFGFTFNSQGICFEKDSKLVFGDLTSLFRYDLDKRKKELIDKDSILIPYSFYGEGDSIWIGYENKLSYLKNDSLHVYFKQSEGFLKLQHPYQILRGEDNNLWVTCFHGVYCFNTQNQKIDSVEQLSGVFVRNVTLINGYTFIATYGDGFYILKGTKLVKMPLDGRDYLKFSHSFLKDKNNFIWITTNQGLFKTHLSDLTSYFYGLNKYVYYVSYDEADGINNSEFNGGCYPSYIRLKNDFVSLPTLDGLVWFTPEKVEDPLFSYPIIVDAIYDNGKFVKPENTILFSSGIKDILFQFATPFYGGAKNLVTEYRLIHDNNVNSINWIPLNSNPIEIKLSNLESGSYILQLRKKNGWGYEKYIYKECSFIIGKKYYETLWFKLFSIFGLVLATYATARLYAFNFQRKNERLEVKVNERTAELISTNDKLQNSIQIKDNLISIISHDFMTPLKFINMVSRRRVINSQNDLKGTLESLKDIEIASEALYNNAQNILSWIKYNNDRIKVKYEYIAMGAFIDDVIDNYSNMAGMRKNSLHSDVSYDDIILTDRNILSIVINNVITNAIKFTEKGNITVSSVTEGNKYSLTVSDTGLGISPEKLKLILECPKKALIQKETQVHVQSGHGMGLIIVSELLTLINGRLNIKSELGKGTSVTIVLNLEKNFIR